jgi:uncharacterized protein (TIGR02246 family)
MHAYVTSRERPSLVSQLPHRFALAWNRHDAEAAFDDFDDDADFVDGSGAHWRGYDEIVARYAALHRTVFAHSELEIGEVLLRLVSVDSAYVIADFTLREYPHDRGETTAPLAERSGTMTFVVARQGSSWRVFAAQVTGRTDAAGPAGLEAFG